MDISRERLLDFLKEQIPDFREDRPLKEQLDSVLLVSLVLLLEEEFSITCDLRVFSEDILRSPETLLGYLESLQGTIQ